MHWHAAILALEALPDQSPELNKDFEEFKLPP